MHRTKRSQETEDIEYIHNHLNDMKYVVSDCKFEIFFSKLHINNKLAAISESQTEDNGWKLRVRVTDRYYKISS